jgi:signal peptidase II
MSQSSPGVPAHRYVLFGAIVAVGLAIDLATKWWAFHTFGMPSPGDPGEPLRWMLRIETGLNEGALFGLGQGKGLAFVALSFVALLGIGLWLFVAKAARDGLVTVALAGVTAGILGNLYDRLGLHALRWDRPVFDFQGRLIHQPGDTVYAVRDWIHFQCPWFDWPIFNVADMLLVGGVALLLWHAYVVEPRQRRCSKAREVAAPPGA